MIKKKVIVQGSLQSLSEIFSSPFNREFEPLAILTDEPEKVTQAVKRAGGRNLRFLLLIHSHVFL